MNLPSPATCPECGASIKPGASMCAACLLSAGAATQPVQPVGAGVAALPCVLGDYRLLRKLGSGGMGIVYEADHLPSGRRLALKVLNQSLDNEEQRQRFLREGRLAATIDHPNSVYVFGTDEIEGLPVIAMELAVGGTLRDEVRRRGPLPVRDAVDAVLGIIDGLEAAHARGILHRDMKPSNCFLTGEGKAMVGDYGLSISHADNGADGEPLTRSGMVMGTPAFSSPEQLRAQPLDLRADIYSTGGTLYYLLTGKAPVERTTPVETVAAVLEGRVPSVSAARPDVPHDLAAVIARCLAAQTAARFSSYAELRLALLPFSSTAAEPAPLGLRFVAGLADNAIYSLLMIVAVVLNPQWGHLWMADETSTATRWTGLGVCTVLAVCAYAFAEWRWGTTPGKWLFGLRVAGTDGARPRWRRAALRAAIFLTVPLVAEESTAWMEGVADFEDGSAGMWAMVALQMCAAFVQLLMFIPALRRPDRAALHDVATGVRVILQRKRSARLIAADSLPVVGSGEMWGPFHAGAEISAGLRLGHDPLLRRAVLLGARAVGHEPSVARRDCARAGRLRWLQSVSDGEGKVWDVWQAPAGSPLMTLLAAEAPRWNQLLCWLDDLAAELSAAEKDHTLPAKLSLGHVWITTDGRALLLDEAWPALPETAVFATTDANAASQRFLGHAAGLCPAVLRPLHADALLVSLKQAVFERLSHISGNFKHLRQKKTDVSRRSRAATVLGPFITVAGIFVIGFLAFDGVQKAMWTAEYPGLPPLPQVLDIHRRLSDEGDWKNPALEGQVRTHLAGHYQSLADDEELAKEMYLDRANLKKLRSLLRAQPEPDATALNAADAAVREAVRAFPGTGDLSRIEWEKAVPVMVLMALILTAALQLLYVLATGRPLLMNLTGVAAVTENQRPAGRARMLWRWCVGWSPLWLVGVILAGGSYAGLWVKQQMPDICLVWLPAYLLLVVGALLLPRRSVVDRIAQTWLVAK